MAYRPIALKKYSFRALSLFPTFVFLSTLLHLVGWNVRLNWLLERLRLQILHRPTSSLWDLQFGVAGEQRGAFEHPAEVLFAGMLMLPGTALEALEGFIADFQSFQMHDADKFLAAFPSLPLLEFHTPTVVCKTGAGQR